MTIRNLNKLLAPKSLAFIGASPDPASVGAIVTANLRAGGFDGPLWFVNPRHSNIEGEPCYAAPAELPGVPDLAVIVTPPETVPQLIGELGAKGTRAAVVITAGVRSDLKTAMLEAAGPTSCACRAPTALGLCCRASGSTPASPSAALTGDLAFFPSPARSSRPSSTGRAGAASASRTWSRSATWPTSTSATCSTTWPATSTAAPSCSTWSRSPTRRSSCRRPGARRAPSPSSSQGRSERQRRQGRAVAHRRARRHGRCLQRRLPARRPLARRRARGAFRRCRNPVARRPSSAASGSRS